MNDDGNGRVMLEDAVPVHPAPADDVSYADINALFRPQLEEQDVQTRAGTIRVRALSRFEGRQIQERHRGDGSYEAALIAAAMVRPTMSLEQVERWEAAWPAGDFMVVSEAVLRLSRLSPEAAKSNLR